MCFEKKICLWRAKKIVILGEEGGGWILFLGERVSLMGDQFSWAGGWGEAGGGDVVGVWRGGGWEGEGWGL